MSMHNDTEVPDAFFTYGAPAEGRYQSRYVGKAHFYITGQYVAPGETRKPFHTMDAWINTPLPPLAGCPTCALVASLCRNYGLRTRVRPHDQAGAFV